MKKALDRATKGKYIVWGKIDIITLTFDLKLCPRYMHTFLPKTLGKRICNDFLHNSAVILTLETLFMVIAHGLPKCTMWMNYEPN